MVGDGLFLSRHARSGYATRLFEIAMFALLTLSLLVACNNGAAEPSANSAPPKVASPAPVSPATTAATDTLSDGATVASWEGGALQYGPVREEVGNQLIKLEADFLSQRYDTQEQAVNDKVNEELLKAEAKKRGLADDRALLAAEVEGKVAAPTESEVQEAYAQLGRRLGGKPLDEVRPQVERAVLQKKQAERFGVFIAELRKSYKVALKLPVPELPRFPVSTDDDPAVGPADAPITIVQFAEFQCPYCGKADATLQEVMKTYEGKIRVVFRDFPLGFHENAIPAAVAANCADKQGKYWPMHHAFMANQRALTEADIQRTAQEVGVSHSGWEECRKDPAMEAEVKADQAAGEALGVTGTPAFFINGIFLNGAQPYEKFQSIIDRELAARPG